MLLQFCKAHTLVLVSELTRQERRKQRTTDAILDAAERLFHEHGYAATTIDAIAEAADVAIGSIYARFAGKEGLYLALVDRALTANEAYMAEAYATHDSPRDQILATGEAYVRFHRDHPLAFRLVGLRDLERSGDPRHRAARKRIAARQQAMLDDIAAAIERASAAGEIRPVDPLATATFLWGAWNGTIALRLRGNLSQRRLQETLDAGFELVRRAIDPV
jgi:AcrR family transcriptional regulator